MPQPNGAWQRHLLELSYPAATQSLMFFRRTPLKVATPEGSCMVCWKLLTKFGALGACNQRQVSQRRG